MLTNKNLVSVKVNISEPTQDFEEMPYSRFGDCRHNIERDIEGGHKNGNVN